jgi:putative DNA primase/helicase
MENPHYNCCCIAKNGGVGIIDIDDIEGCVTSGMPALAETFTVRSPKGLHWYFVHTPETEALGNREVKDPKGKIIFELKAHNKACCAPGCVRDDGGEYVLATNRPLALGLSGEHIKWIEANSRVSLHATTERKRKFHPEFDEQHLFDYYNWEFADDFVKEDGAHYFVFRECPIKGGPHDDQVRSKKTCLILGDTVGFKCMVCGDSYGWKELVAQMEKQGILPYDYMIFADEDDDIVLSGVESCDDSDDEIEADDTEVDTTGYEYELTDTGNAERLVRKFGTQIKYVRDQGVWRIWDGKVWKTDRRNKIDRMAKIIVRELAVYAGEAEGDEQKRRYRWVMISGGKERRNAMVTLAAMEKDVVSLSTDYDRDDWLFNLQNGTIDLKTGKLLPHNRRNLCSKISKITYNSEVRCPLFDKFLAEVQDDESMVTFLAQAVGYSLTGDTSEQAFFFTHGNGANGKSVFNLAVASIMGDYAKVASFDTLIVKKNDTGPKNDLAALVGARLVQCAESKEGQTLDVDLIKSLTGGEEITVRFLHKEFFSYQPKFKIWMSSNSEPSIRGTDWGTWRRVKEIPFDVTITNPDPHLAAKLRKEASGILNWALAGLSSYLESGLAEPERVKDATKQYRESQDTIGLFLRAKCVVKPEAEIKGAELYSNYRQWAEANREFVMKESQFTKRLLKVYGIERKQKRDGKWYVGVGQTASTTGYEQMPEDVFV